MMKSLCGAWVILVCAVWVGRAGEWQLQVVPQPPPETVNAALRQVLAAQAMQLREDGQLVQEMWWVKHLPLTAPPAFTVKALEQIPMAALMGVIHIVRPSRDYRDDDLPVGFYTLRFALQPQDGNHLGSAEYPYFAVAVPIRLDAAPEAIRSYKALVKASGRETSTDHPMSLSLRPAKAVEGEYPRLVTPLPDHRSILLRLEGRVAEKTDGVPLPFELVFRGMGHK